MTITIEMIDELRKRSRVSYQDAKEALEKHNGSLVESLVYLEKNNKIKFTSASERNRFLDRVKALIDKGNNVRFIVSKDDRTVLNLSLTISILIGAVTFHISAIAAAIGLITGYKFKFEKNSGEDMKVNVVLDKVHDNIDNFKKEI